MKTKEQAKAEAQAKADEQRKATSIYKRHTEDFWRVWWSGEVNWMKNDKDIAEYEIVAPTK